MPAPPVMGIYLPDSISEVAQSLPIDPLGPGAAELLAGDVEYRIHLIVQEAKKFMVNAKRGTLMPEDIEYAMEALNVEPVLIPPTPLPQQPFLPVPQPVGSTSTSSNHQQLYHVVDDEIDFATYLKQPLPAGLASSAGVKWKAHWLAVEGVQPAIPENPLPLKAGPSRLPAPTTGPASLKQSAKSQLPTELQLYFTRLTTALIPPVSLLPTLPGNPPSASDSHSLPDAERHRVAALASLRSDAAVAGLLVYIVKWLGESIQKCLSGHLGTLGCLIDVLEALLDNQSLFMEPYLHQLLAPLLSIIVTVPLGPHPPSSLSSSTPSAFDIRSRAAEVLGKIASVYGKSYVGLVPRLISTLSKTLQSSPFPSPLGANNPPAGRYEGAVLGLASLGAPAVRSGLWGSGGEGLIRVDDLAGRLYPNEGARGRGKNGLMKACIRALNLIINPKPPNQDLIPPFNSTLILEHFGPNFAKSLEKRPWMASELLRLRREDQVEPEEKSGEDGMEVDIQ